MGRTGSLRCGAGRVLYDYALERIQCGISIPKAAGQVYCATSCSDDKKQINKYISTSAGKVRGRAKLEFDHKLRSHAEYGRRCGNAPAPLV